MFYVKNMGMIALLFATIGYTPQNTIEKNELTDSVTNVVRPDNAATNGYYIANRKPLQPLYFIKLPVGAIQPKGWLMKYLELQRDGLTGHLGEISAWLAKKNNAWLSPDGKGDHGWEEVPYWLKGYANLGYILNDKKIIAEATTWINAVLASQLRGIELIKDGASGGAIHAEVNRTLESRGYTTGVVNGRNQGFFHGTGHGVGLDIHELPRISRLDYRLEAGHVVTVEPGLYYPGKGAVRIEDMVLVEAGGCRDLTHAPKMELLEL